MINLKLNEHDALQLLALIRNKIWQDDKIWRNYWERLARDVEKSIERACEVESVSRSGC